MGVTVAVRAGIGSGVPAVLAVVEARKAALERVRSMSYQITFTLAKCCGTNGFAKEWMQF